MQGSRYGNDTGHNRQHGSGDHLPHNPPERNDWPHETAEALLRLSLDQSDLDRLHELVVKNQDDALTPAEKAELESYLRVSFLVDLMHAKALCSLKKHS